MMSVEERVERGIALLNERGPYDWRERIDLGILDIEMPTFCVLGQVFGGYLRGIEALDIVDRTDQVLHGFERSVNDIDDFDALNDAWQAALAE